MEQIIIAFTVLIITIITTYFQKLKSKYQNISHYIEIFERLTVATVQSLNGEIVDVLKANKQFTKEEQEKVFKKAVERIKAQLTTEAQSFLKLVYGDLDEYIKTLVVAKVETIKLEKKQAETPTVAIKMGE